MIETKKTPDTLWTKKETSIHLRCSIKTIERLIRDGRINAFKIGNRKVLVYAESVIEENLNAIKPKFLN